MSAHGGHAHLVAVATGMAVRLNNSSTEHSNTAASARAVATDGDSRSPSMALTAAREIPARSASSACDHSRADRRNCTGCLAIIISFGDRIVSFHDQQLH
jgi:hypothetical protein